MSFEVVGKLYRVFDTEKKTETFQARDFVIEIEDGNYPQHIKFQLVQDRCNLIDNFTEGDAVKVHFDLRGREWKDKFFTNLNAWRIESADSNGKSAPTTGPTDQPFPTIADEPPVDKADDDLPF